MSNRKVWGQLRKITDMNAFLASWLATGGKPTAGHAPWGRTPVRLVCDFPTACSAAASCHPRH